MNRSTNALRTRSWFLTNQRALFPRCGILNLQGASAACKTIVRFHTTPTTHRRPFLLRHKSGDLRRSEMADDDKKQTDDLTDEKEKEKEEAKPEIPSPPEKPLPGDCCGSGCVRCVWDVYYEELEEYNNRLTNIADSKS